MQLRLGQGEHLDWSVPQDWPVTSLGSVLRFQVGFPFSSEFFNREGVGVRLIKNRDLKTDDQVFYYSGPYDSSYVVRDGDLLVGMDGDFLPCLWRKGDALLNQRVGRLVPVKGLDRVFAHYFLITSLKEIESATSSTTVKHLSHGDIEGVCRPLPPESEQLAIASALSDTDALLDGLDRLIAKKRDLKQAVMQQLLTGRIRLPGFFGEWEVKRLGDICDLSIGRTPPRLDQACWGRGHVWLSIADLKSKVVTQSNEQITELAASTMTPVPKGTLLMSFKLSIGRLAFAGCDLFTNEAICSFHNLKASAEYMYYALSRTDLSSYGKQAVKGYTLNKESLKLVEVRLPPEMEQTAIAAVLSDMDAEIAALEARRDKTLALKQAMMKELLTGRTRLV